MLLDLVNRISSEKKVKKTLDIQDWVLWRSFGGRPENVLGTFRIKLPGTSLERQIKTSPGRHFRTSPGRQLGTSLGRSNRIFRRRPGDVGGERPRDVLRTNICRLGMMNSQICEFKKPSKVKRQYSVYHGQCNLRTDLYLKVFLIWCHIF